MSQVMRSDLEPMITIERVLYDHSTTQRNLDRKHISRDFLRRMLQGAAGHSGYQRNEIEAQLDGIRDGMGYANYWKRWRYDIMYDLTRRRLKGMDKATLDFARFIAWCGSAKG